MSDRPVLKLMEFERDEGISHMAGTLTDALSEVREGRVAGLAVLVIQDGAVSTRWAFKSRDGHAHLMISAATRLVHDLHQTAHSRNSEYVEDDGA
jgi:hypothetical protein